MMTNNAYCFPSVWGDILRCTVKRGGGLFTCLCPAAHCVIIHDCNKAREAIRDEDVETRSEQPEESQMDTIHELAHIQAGQLELF